MNMYWTASKHAIENAVERFDISEDEAVNWMNQIMNDSLPVEHQEDGRIMYQHRKQDIALVASSHTKTIITIMRRSAAKARVRTDLLEPIIVGMRSSLGGMEDVFNRRMQALADQYAEFMLKAAELMSAEPADAEAIETVLKHVADVEGEMQMARAEYRLARNKVEAFIESSTPEDEGRATA